MCTHLVVPRLFGLELDTIDDGIASGVMMLHHDLCQRSTALQLANSSLQVGLNDVAKHLHIVSTGTIAFGNSSIDVAAVIELIGQSELWQQLIECGLV